MINLSMKFSYYNTTGCPEQDAPKMVRVTDSSRLDSTKREGGIL